MEPKLTELDQPDGASELFESDATLRRWLSDRAALIEAGMADARAGRTVGFDEVEAWIDSWGTDHELPKPCSNSQISELGQVQTHE